MITKRKKKSSDEPGTSGVRTYRFDPKLWQEFEEDCALNLYNPRAVVEALVLEWLHSDDPTRKEVARKKREWDRKRE